MKSLFLRIFIITLLLILLSLGLGIGGIFLFNKNIILFSLFSIALGITFAFIIIFIFLKPSIVSFLKTSFLNKVNFSLKDTDLKRQPLEYLEKIFDKLINDLNSLNLKFSLLQKYLVSLDKAFTFNDLIRALSEVFKSLSFIEISLILRIQKDKNLFSLYPVFPENAVSKKEFSLSEVEPILKKLQEKKFLYKENLDENQDLNVLEKIFLEKGYRSSFILGVGKDDFFCILGIATKRIDSLSKENLDFIKNLGILLETKIAYMDLSEKLEKKEEEIFELKDSQKEKLAELKAIFSQVVQAGKMASLGQLSAGVAHELNNPIAGILGYTQLILNKLNSPQITSETIEGSVKYLKLMEREAKRCQGIISNLLNFSRKSSEEKVPLDIREVIENTLSMLEYQLNKSNVKISLSFPPEGLKKINGNANQLQQVFTNLIQNALDAMPEGGQLTITAENKVDLRFKPPLEYIEIRVSDTGCGIPQENLSKIFDPFFTSKLGKPGTGLGLSISYAIISSHKGLISVESQVGKGTTFIITLPAIKE